MSASGGRESPLCGKRKRYIRKRSSGEFSIEELSPDDMGYDADVETIKPDKYEEVDSESEDAPTPDGTHWHSVDEELAARMRHLGREQSAPVRHGHERGRKRRSIEMEDETLFSRGPQSPGLEVQEVVDSAGIPSPAKRRRKKSRRPQTTSRRLGAWTDSSEQLKNNNGGHRHDLSASTTASEQVTPQRNEDNDMMDVT